MKQTITKQKVLGQALQQQKQATAAFLKLALTCQEKGQKTLLKQFEQELRLAKRLHTQLQMALQQLAETLPPSSPLDALYEEVVEWNKRAETKATLENRKAYQAQLTNFLAAYNAQPSTIQAAWATAAATCQQELAASQARVATAENVKERIEKLEQQEKAKIYFIVKGVDKNGQTWGRIDYVGAAYIMAYADNNTGSNDLPLEVHYYTYTDGSYQSEGKSNQLQTAFDKQLMDAFQKSGLVSYEQYKNLGRDYEYKPSKAPITGKGPWYLRLEAPLAANRVAKEIEVPDWEDFGFGVVYDQYLKDCAAGSLTKTEALARKAQLQEALEQQQVRIKELEHFHRTENDSDDNTAVLLEIWKNKSTTMERALREDLKENCIKPVPNLPPCEDFDAIYQQHQTLCDRYALPKRVGDLLKQNLADCIATGEKVVLTLEEALRSYRAIPNWETDAEISALVREAEEKLMEQRARTEQEKTLLAGLPEECLRPLALEVFFEPSSNKIREKDNKQLTNIALFLKRNPMVKVKLIGNTSMSSNYPIENNTKKVKEEIETVHLMPDDELPENWTTAEVAEFRQRSLKIKDLMLIRTEHVKSILVKLGVDAGQIDTQPGKNLGKPDDSREQKIKNRKVIVEFY
jgi:outer membrane protein OmpA-like peptidoglycan-associated protein